MYVVADWGSRKEPGGCSAFLLSDNQYRDRLWERMDELKPPGTLYATSRRAVHLINSGKISALYVQMQFNGSCGFSTRKVIHGSCAWAHPITVCEELFDRQEMWWMLSRSERLRGSMLNPLISIQSCLNSWLRRCLCYLEEAACDTIGCHFLLMKPQAMLWKEQKVIWARQTAVDLWNMNKQWSWHTGRAAWAPPL